jgi:hypothetical protein
MSKITEYENFSYALFYNIQKIEKNNQKTLNASFFMSMRIFVLLINFLGEGNSNQETQLQSF